MTLLGIIALIVLVIAALMVLRVKSDPMEKESVRRHLSASKASEPSTEPRSNSNNASG